jgi:hypothetical protein
VRSTAVLLAGVVLAVVVGCAATAGAGAPARRPGQPGAFGWLVPTLPPSSWRAQVIPLAAATLSSPPSFSPFAGDTGSATAGIKDANGVYRAYLNATPQQGRERLRGFPGFRVRLLGEDHDLAVHEEASAEHLAFRGGEGSCVIDRYVTRVAHHRYREIACLVVSASGRGSVVVAAARLADWARFEATMRTAVASYRVA